MTKPESSPIFNSHVVALLFILALVSAFASFAIDAMGEAKDTKNISFISSVPAIAQLHHLSSGNYDRLCERIAQEAYLSSIEINSYQCGSAKNGYYVSIDLMNDEKLCVSSRAPSTKPQSCQ